MLLRRVEKFLRGHDMLATKFGRLVAHDPRFVLDLRMGRWMAEYEAPTPNKEPDQ